MTSKLYPVPANGPRRIQRQRTKGWRMPRGTVYVGRPTKWGNPFAIGDVIDRVRVIPTSGSSIRGGVAELIVTSSADAAEAYRRWIAGTPMLTERARPTLDELRDALRGRDLVCWCPLDQPCHADVLLELANGDAK